MAIFSSNGRHSAKKSNGKKILIIILCILIAAALVAVAIHYAAPIFTPKEEEETQAPTTTIIQNDPHMGQIEIPYVDDMDKNEYDPDGFATDENGFMTYSENGKVVSHLGIDASELQSEIDFNLLKAQGIEFVILRIGGRGYGSEGSMYPDTKFDEYYENAKNAGLKVGAYFFSQAKNSKEGEEEAEYALGLLDDRELDYPLAFDWELIENEPTARTNGVSVKDLTDAAVAFCDAVSDSGYTPVIYTNTSLIYTNYDLTRIKNYDLWHAEYTSTPSLFYNFTIWQYTYEGQLEGVSGNVDINVCMKEY